MEDSLVGTGENFPIPRKPRKTKLLSRAIESFAKEHPEEVADLAETIFTKASENPRYLAILFDRLEGPVEKSAGASVNIVLSEGRVLNPPPEPAEAEELED